MLNIYVSGLGSLKDTKNPVEKQKQNLAYKYKMH